MYYNNSAFFTLMYILEFSFRPMKRWGRWECHFVQTWVACRDFEDVRPIKLNANLVFCSFADCTYNETSASTKSDLAKSTATPTPTAQNTTQSSMQETTTSAASSPSPNTSRCFCEQVRQSSIEMTAEKIVEELRLKEQTSARRRQLETTSDHRASAQLMGLTAVAVLVTVALAVIIPDLIALFVWTTVKLQMVKKQGLKTSRLSPEVSK